MLMKYYIQWGGCVWFRTDDRYPTFRWTDHVGKEMNNKGIPKPCGLFDETAENFTFSINFFVFPHVCKWFLRGCLLRLLSADYFNPGQEAFSDTEVRSSSPLENKSEKTWPHPFPSEPFWVDLQQAKVIADFPTVHPCLQAFTVNFKRLLVRSAVTFSHNSELPRKESFASTSVIPFNFKLI